jgi:N-acetyl-gamma-glutamyl-phosphate reductase
MPVLLEHRADQANRTEPLNGPRHERLACTTEAVREAALSAVFLATPADVSMELAPPLLGAGTRVIDLSGAFRLPDSESYQRWYGADHTAPGLLDEAVYGLPEFCRTRIAGARLISNPGCYPTAANLAIQPLVEAGVIDLAAGVICDAKSGVSGAGRKPTLATSFCEVTENFSAYAALEHRHVPEVLMISGLEERQFSFTAQLLPVHRGILETIYFRTAGGSTAAEILDVYQRRYAGEAFVRLYRAGEFPDLAAVQRTNFCDIGVTSDPASGRAVVVSAIDNLVKGAAGQAIQNMNLALGFGETEGLL